MTKTGKSIDMVILDEASTISEFGEKWPCVNNALGGHGWNTDLSGLMRRIVQAEGQRYWGCNRDIKYLTIRIDTRNNNFLLYADGRGDASNAPNKFRICPSKVIEAMERWDGDYGGKCDSDNDKWILNFADVEVDDIHFSGVGAREAAHKTFDAKRTAYTCSLYQIVAEG